MIEIEVRGKTIEFEDGTSKRDIDKVVNHLFPPTDEESYNLLQSDLSRKATAEQFEAFKRHDETRDVKWGEAIWEGAKGIGSIVAEGVKSGASLLADGEFSELGVAAGESFLRGTSDLGLIYMKTFKNAVDPLLTDEES